MAKATSTKDVAPPVVGEVIQPAAASLPLPVLEKEVRPVGGTVVLPPAWKPSTNEADVFGFAQRKRKWAKPDLDVSGIPSLLLEAGEFGPDLPEELMASIRGAREIIKYFYSTILIVGLSEEPGFKISFEPSGGSSPRD